MPMPSFNPSAGPKTGTVKPAVITSRAAKSQLDTIKVQHANIVSGISNQAVRVQAYNDQKAARLQNEEIMRNEVQKNMLAANTESQKNAQDFALRQSEIDIKRASLTS